MRLLIARTAGHSFASNLRISLSATSVGRSLARRRREGMADVCSMFRVAPFVQRLPRPGEPLKCRTTDGNGRCPSTPARTRSATSREVKPT